MKRAAAAFRRGLRAVRGRRIALAALVAATSAAAVRAEDSPGWPMSSAFGDRTPLEGEIEPDAPAPPTDNPVATFYNGPEGYPAWTDAIPWTRVIDMSRYGRGGTDFEKFEAARDQLAASGGGVLYYPAGTYDFSQGPFDGPQGRGLMLRSGVVIRGEAPRGKPKATAGKMDLSTRFVFGFTKRDNVVPAAGGVMTRPETPRDWNLIGLAPAKGKGVKDVENVGVAWVHLVGATIFFGADNDWGKTWRTAGSFKSAYVKDSWADRVPDGTHPWDALAGGGKTHVGSGRGRLVFGCVLEDSVGVNNSITMGRPDTPGGFGPDGYYMGKFMARISVTASRVFVANNLIPKSTGRNFKYRQLTRYSYPGGKGNSMAFGEESVETILFDYNKALGIDVNKGFLGLTGQRRPEEAGRQGFFNEGVVVRDNWVYNHGHKGFNVSGRWVTIQGNHNERDFLREGEDPYGIGDWELTLDGYVQSSPGGNGAISDNLSRGYDLAGQNLWVDGNYMNNTGSSPGNDGEGILCQAHGGTQLYSWAITHNRHERGTGKRAYIGAWNVEMYGALMAWNETAGWVGGVMFPRPPADVALVGNRAEGGTKGPANALLESRGGRLQAPAGVSAEAYEGDAVSISWRDASRGEIGFRVDRRIGDDPWATIAYRPPHIEGSVYNPQQWVDFTAPSGKQLVYRVVAIDVRDSGAGASGPTKGIRLGAARTRPRPAAAGRAAPAEPAPWESVEPVAKGSWNIALAVPRPPRKGKPQRPSVAHLWLPQDGRKIRGLVVAGKILLESVICRDPVIREAAAEKHLGILYFEPHFSATFNYAATDCEDNLLKTLAVLAEKVKRPELALVPWLTMGHSTGGIFCRNMAYWRPDRVIGIVHIKSGNFQDGIQDGTRTLAGVPLLAINGEFEEYGPAGGDLGRGLRSRYSLDPHDKKQNNQSQWVLIRMQMIERRRKNPDNLMSLVVHRGGNHRSWDADLSALTALFIRSSVDARLALDVDASSLSSVVRCRRLRARDGWLSDADIKAPRFKPAPFAAYKGDKTLAFWHTDRQMAEAVVRYHAGAWKEGDPTASLPSRERYTPPSILQDTIDGGRPDREAAQ